MKCRNLYTTNKPELLVYLTKEATSSKLSKLGNPLEKFHKMIDFETFRQLFESRILNQTKRSKAGCKPYDVVVMFKDHIVKTFL